jgi:replicative superfamily II helicase
MAFYAKLNMDDILQKSSFESLYQRFGRGDFTSLQENMEWLVEASLKISKVILISNFKTQKVISDMLNILSKRISFGMIKEELLELCSIREIGRIRSILLQNAGIISINQLINPYNKWTITNVLGSEQITRRVIEDARKIYNEKNLKTTK